MEKTLIATVSSAHHWKAVSRPVKPVAETSTQLHGFEKCHCLSFTVYNRPSLKSLAFPVSDSSKSPIKIAYPERSGMGEILNLLCLS